MRTVVIADDSFIMRKIIRGALDHLGYRVIGEADSGEAAVEMYKKLKPDIVTLDVVMGDMSGIEAMKHIIRFEAAASVVVISSMSQEPLVHDAIMAGAKGFLVKPFDIHQVKRTFGKI